jgi:replicative DNA helicase
VSATAEDFDAEQDWRDPPAVEPPWPIPLPIMTARDLPSFPTAALPEWQGTFAAAVAEATQTPSDLPGVMVLAATAAAAGGRAVVEVRSGWREPLNLYVACGMPPGSRKSAVFAACTEPLLHAEQVMADAASQLITEAKTQQAVAEAAAKRAATTDGGERDQALAEATEAALMAEAVTVPVRPRLIADDATPEAIGSLLAEQGGRMALLSPEGDVFEVMAGRYRDGAANISMFLKAHAGDMLKVDRKGRPSEYVPRPALTIAAAVQPSVVESMTRNDGFRGRGLLARFLWSLPESNMGYRRVNADPVPDEVRARYSTDLAALVASLAEWTDPAVITLTPEAHAALVELERTIEPRLIPNIGDLSHIADWAGKYAGAVVRIAGLLHLADNLRTGWAQPITADTMDRARRIGHYFLAHALSAFDLMGADPTRLKAAKVASWLTDCAGAEVTRRDMYAAHRADFPKAEDIDPVIAILVEHDWLRRLPDPPKSIGRPPSPKYAVNPQATR